MKQKKYRFAGVVLGSILASTLIGYVGSDKLFFWTKESLIDAEYYAEQRDRLINIGAKSNTLADEIVKFETNARKNPTEKQFHLAQSERLRETFSKEYTEMSNIMEGRLLEILRINQKMSLPTKELIYALREVAIKSHQANYSLPKIHLQDIYFRDKTKVSKKDIFENIDPDSQTKIIKLKRELGIKKSSRDSQQAASILREMSDIYKEQAKTIAIKSPSFVETTKEVGNYLGELANDVEKDINKLPEYLNLEGI
jgi:hypothetical protein